MSSVEKVAFGILFEADLLGEDQINLWMRVDVFSTEVGVWYGVSSRGARL